MQKIRVLLCRISVRGKILALFHAGGVAVRCNRVTITPHRWRIQLSGDAALNLLGLSTQVPGCWIYLSDGPGRKYEIGKHSLVFKKPALRDVGFKYRESGLMVQALKALGREHVVQKVIERIRQQLESNACDRIINLEKSIEP